MRVRSPDGTSVPATVDQFTFVAPPTVTKLKKVPKTKALISGGDGVMIIGTGFTTASAVTFGSSPAASFTIVNDTTINAVTPVMVFAGPVDVTVTNTGGTSAINKHDVCKFKAVTPTVTSVVPNAGPVAGGTVVTITGTFFTPGALVLFGAIPATNVTCTQTSCTATAPAAKKAGAVDVRVKANKKPSKKTPPADTFTYS